jgi:circadian clock protein KaiC
MNEKDRIKINRLPTGVPGLDTVLGGGLPEYSFNLIAGEPGAGKTTLALQIMFANATSERGGLYFTVLGEPPVKMLRYQQQFSFFDAGKVGECIRLVNLSEAVLKQDLNQVLERIVRELEETDPAIVVVDSFRTVTGSGGTLPSERDLQAFLQRLALHLTSWQATSFLVGEYLPEDRKNEPVFTVADGIVWLSQAIDRNSMVRKLQVGKIRGQAPMPGLHTFRITDDGVQVFPRIPEQQLDRALPVQERLGTGVPGLDELMGGGIPAGDAVMLTGPTGSGKTTFAMQFIAEGLRQGEACVTTVFEEYPEEYLARARAREPLLEESIRAGRLEIIYLRPLDLSVDETLAAILDAVQRLGARRVVIDSLSGFAIALAPSFREDFRESLYRLVGALTATGVTVFMTDEVVAGYPDIRFTSDKVSFVTDAIVVQRYVEIRGELRRVLAVVKMRGSDHSHDFRTYEITAKGAVVGGRLRDYHGILTGIPELRARVAPSLPSGLTDREAAVLALLTELDGGSREILMARAGLPPEELAAVLERLVAQGYASAITHEGQSVYKARAQPGE